MDYLGDLGFRYYSRRKHDVVERIETWKTKRPKFKVVHARNVYSVAVDPLRLGLLKTKISPALV